MGTTDDGQVKQQTIVMGPVAAMIPIKQVGTNGGGFFGANAAHPFENPSAWTNFLTCLGMMLFPSTLVLMFGRMLRKMRHAVVIYGVMGVLLIGMIGWAVHWDALHPNPGITAHAADDSYSVPSATAKDGKRAVPFPAVAGLPVNQELGNLEGAELRFGTSAGATFAAVTTAFTCGAVNRAHDSLHPLAGLSPMVGMWLNCVFGGKGVGMINLLLFLIVGVFYRGPDGWPYARIPGPEGGRQGDEARDDRVARAPDHDSRPNRSVFRHGMGHKGGEQSGGAWV